MLRRCIERTPYERYSRIKVLHDERRFDAKDAVTKANELAIPASVARSAITVRGAVNFHDEARHGSQEVRDEPACNGHLTTEGDPKLAGVETRPQTRCSA